MAVEVSPVERIRPAVSVSVWRTSAQWRRAPSASVVTFWPATLALRPLGATLIAVIVGNPAMINAYKAGIPGNGKPFPDGSKMAKIHWNAKKSADAPSPTMVPDTLHDVDFMARDSKRFAKTGNWGYAQFNYDGAADAFTPLGSGSDCGFACHTIVKTKDYVFTTFPKR